MINFKKYAFWTLEVIIWIGLFLIPASFISYILNPDLDIKQECTLEFSDINGVIIGSPINFEGYNIGFVKKIELLPNSVLLTLAITQEDYHFPACAKVKIEESGLGGSRSLEIYSCDEDDEFGCGLHPQKLKRINELLEEMNQFMDALLEGMNNMWYILESNINSDHYINSKENKEKIRCISCELGTLTRRFEQTNESANRHLPVYINNLNRYIDLIQKINIEPERIKNNQLETEARLNNINNNLSFYNPLIAKKQAFRLYCITEFIKRPNMLPQDMAIFNYYLDNLRNSLKSVEKFVSPEAIEKRSQSVKDFKQNTEDISDF